jgi:hypothetical protein
VKTIKNRYLKVSLGIMCMFAAGALGCVAPAETDEASASAGTAADDEVEVDPASLASPRTAAEALGDKPLPPPPPLGCLAGPTGGPRTCFYDAPELRYTDQWKCTPAGDFANGRCKTTVVGKSVSFSFFTQSTGSSQPGIVFTWRPSDAQGSARVVIDGVDRGLVWQGGDSPGIKAIPLAPGHHQIQLIKPARDGDRAIGIRYFVNGI